MNLAKIKAILKEIIPERKRQEEKFGPQSHPNGTEKDYKNLPDYTRLKALQARQRCRASAQKGEVTWAEILEEEFWEAVNESEPDKLRDRLIKVIAVGVNWMEDIDRKTEQEPQA